MLIRCPYCDKECETEVEIAPGQHVLCPFCEAKFSYSPQETTAESVANGKDGQNETVCTSIKIVCPYCGANYEVDAGYEGEIATCGSCSKKFVVQVVHEQQTGLQKKKKASTPHKKVMRKFVLPNNVGNQITKQANVDVTEKDRKHNTSGCIPAILLFLSCIFVEVFHNWASVAASVACAFTAIMIWVYNKLYTQMEGQTTIGDIFKRLGIGGSSIFLIASALGYTFLMHSCDRQAKEEELESLKQERERKAKIERDGGWAHSQRCPNCNYDNVFWIYKGEDPYRKKFQCESCRHWMKYESWTLF